MFLRIGTMLFPLPGGTPVALLCARAHPSLRSQDQVPFHQRGFPEPPASVSSLCAPSPSSQCFLMVPVTTHSCTPSSSVPLWSNVHVLCWPVSSMWGGACQLFTNTGPAPGAEWALSYRMDKWSLFLYFGKWLSLKKAVNQFLWACGFLEEPSPNVGEAARCCCVASPFHVGAVFSRCGDESWLRSMKGRS